MTKNYFEDMVSIFDFLGDLEDPRGPIHRYQSLSDLIVICEVIAAADGPKSIGGRRDT
ncbi:MAG: hypothetical protein O2931_02560 [Planctomycetota bacterium]|nr:hypothetical protein [Planctomycetota bacterium]MDA1177657.1 hypothetical protein [Planctomycetota bacterium]